MRSITTQLRTDSKRIALAATGVALLSAALAGTTQAAPAQGGPNSTIRGTVNVGGSGGYTLTVNVRLQDKKKDDKASGTVSLTNGATGNVVEITTPTGDRDYYCINVLRTDLTRNDQRANFYIRDTGDGATTLDQFAITSGIGLTYAMRPAQFLTAESGNFMVR